jgi:hypothetical protein
MMDYFLIVMVTFLWLLLPTMILTYLLNWIPRLRCNPGIPYGIVALIVALGAAAFATEGEYEFVLCRSLAGVLMLGVLALDYRRTMEGGMESSGSGGVFMILGALAAFAGVIWLRVSAVLSARSPGRGLLLLVSGFAMIGVGLVLLKHARSRLSNDAIPG